MLYSVLTTFLEQWNFTMKPEDYTFSEEDVEQLRQYGDRQSDARLRQRFIVLLMLETGQDRSYIASILGVSQSSIYQWLNQYLHKGIEALNSFQYQSKKSALSSEQTKELVDWVKKQARQSRSHRELCRTHL